MFKPYSGVKTGILMFRKPMGEGSRKSSDGRVLFYEIQNDGYDPDKITGGGRPETPEKNDIPELIRLWKAYKETNFSKTPGIEAGTLLPPGSEAPRAWWATVEAIAENDYNLGAGRYKPQIAAPGRCRG